MMSRDDYYRWPLLQACQELHEFCTGSSDVMTFGEARDRYEWLRMRHMTWKWPAPKRAPFDMAAHNLMVATLREFELGYAHEVSP